MTDATVLATLSGAIGGFREFAAAVNSAVPRPASGSTAEGDQSLSGNKLVPHGVVAGLMSSVADHLDAWAEKAGDRESGTIHLHLFADYSLFRPILEGLVEVIWILDGDNSNERIKRALEVAKIEYKHGMTLTSALNRAGTPDHEMSAGMLALGRIIRATATLIGLEPEEFIAERPVDPSALTRKIAHRVPGPTLQTLSYWALTSAHAHGQIISAFRFAVESPLEEPHRGGALLEPDEVKLAELILFVKSLLDIVVRLLNEQGYELAR